MHIILSPAKRLDFESENLRAEYSNAAFIDQASELAAQARKLSAADLQDLMGISDNLAELNHRRYQDFSPPFDLSNARQALFAFRGDAYQGLDADSLSDDDLAFAQDHLRILSGLYGVLRPLDLIQAYRLEMGIKFRNQRGQDLYAFWNGALAEHMNAELKADDGVLINLASNEYSKAVLGGIEGRIITPQFKEIRNGVPKVMSVFAKKARGMMTRYIIQNRITDPEQIKDFDVDGYAYNPALSEGDNWVFSRG